MVSKLKSLKFATEVGQLQMESYGINLKEDEYTFGKHRTTVHDGTWLISTAYYIDL